MSFNYFFRSLENYCEQEEHHQIRDELSQLQKRENQRLLSLSDPLSFSFDDKDIDICYLTLKCLTYEVHQHLFTNQENPLFTSLFSDNMEQCLSRTEQQVRNRERSMESLVINIQFSSDANRSNRQSTSETTIGN